MKIFNKNALTKMQQMINENKKVDLIITDPPYKITSRGNSGGTGGMLANKLSMEGKIFKHNNIKPEDYAELCFNILKDQTHCYIMTNHINLQKTLNEFTKVGFKFIKSIIWNKPNKIVGRWYMGKFEYILMFRKGAAKPINNVSTPDVIETPSFKKQKNEHGKNLHDTEKPVELMEILIKNSSLENETVLDMFMGIGTTGVAAKNLNRNFIGIELDENYFNIAKDKLDIEEIIQCDICDAQAKYNLHSSNLNLCQKHHDNEVSEL